MILLGQFVEILLDLGIVVSVFATEDVVIIYLSVNLRNLLLSTRCKVPHVCEIGQLLAGCVSVGIPECMKLEVVLWNQLFGLQVKCTTQIELNAL